MWGERVAAERRGIDRTAVSTGVGARAGQAAGPHLIIGVDSRNDIRRFSPCAYPSCRYSS